MWYAVYRSDSGALVSVGTVLADPLPEGLEVREYADWPVGAWDAETRSFVIQPPPPVVLSRIDFVRRFEVAEREALKEMLLNGTAVQKRRVGAFVDYLGYSDEVSLGDSYIIDSVGLMEAVGLIGPGRADEVLGREAGDG